MGSAPGATRWAVLAVGDLCLQRKPAGRPGFKSVLAELARAQAVFGNLEVVLTNSTRATDKLLCLRANPTLATEVARARIGVVSLANNHAADFGADGLRDTRRALAEAGVKTVGAGEDLNEALESAQWGGAAFLGVATTLPNGCSAARSRPGIAPVRVLSRYVIDPVTMDETPGMAPYVETLTMPGDVERVCTAVQRAATIATPVIVGVHWGVPDGWMAAFQGELADYQRPLAHALVDAGAAAVVGHHSHVIHGVELYRGRPIFYSLGNFVFHSLLDGDLNIERPYPGYDWTSLRGERNRYGAVAALQWEPSDPAPYRVEVWPLVLESDGEPRFADDVEATSVLERLNGSCRPLGTSVLEVRRDGRLVGVVKGKEAL